MHFPPVFSAVVAWGCTYFIFEGFCENQCIFVAVGTGDVLNRKVGKDQLFLCPGYAESGKVILGGKAQAVFKNSIQIASVYIQEVCDIRDSNGSGVIIFNILNGLMNIDTFPGVLLAGICKGILCQYRKKFIQLSLQIIKIRSG